MFSLRSKCQIAGMSFKPNVGRMSLRMLLAALYYAMQTCLAGIAARALVVVVIRNPPTTPPLLNTENAQRHAVDDLLPATILAKTYAMMALTVDSAYHLVR
jgi:hypothetical protein